MAAAQGCWCLAWRRRRSLSSSDGGGNAAMLLMSTSALDALWGYLEIPDSDRVGETLASNAADHPRSSPRDAQRPKLAQHPGRVEPAQGLLAHRGRLELAQQTFSGKVEGKRADRPEVRRGQVGQWC